jgi:hypothetical protein
VRVPPLFKGTPRAVPDSAVFSLRHHTSSWEGEEQRSLLWLRCVVVPGVKLNPPAVELATTTVEVDSCGHRGHASPLRSVGHAPKLPCLDLEFSHWLDPSLNSSSLAVHRPCSPSRKPAVRAATAPLPRACDVVAQIGHTAPSRRWPPPHAQYGHAGRLSGAVAWADMRRRAHGGGAGRLRRCRAAGWSQRG